MSSDNETVADIVNETKFAIDYGNGVLLDLAGKQAIGILDRIEAAHKREIAAKDAEIAELRECVKQACEVACGDCRLAVWNNQKFVKCKKHKNWKCPFGTERWRSALEGGAS